MQPLLKLVLTITSWLILSPAFAEDSSIEKWLSNTTPKLEAGAKAVQWKFAHPAPPVSLLPPIWQKGFDWLEAKSNGRFAVNVYGGGTLYGAAGGIKALRAGIADYGTCYTLAEARGFELFKTLHLPFVAPSNPYLTARIINELMASGLKDEFERRGVYPAHVVPMRPLSLMSKTPIRTPKDLKGKKVLSFMNAPGAAQTLGYSDVRLPFPEIYTALQQGLLDAVIWVDMGFVPFKIYEQAKYYTAINVAPVTIETCFNRKSFDRLPSDLKQTVYDFQQKVGVSVVQKAEQFSTGAKDTLLDKGVTFIELDEDSRRQWKAAFAPSVEKWMSDCEAAGKDCRTLVKQIDALREKYDGVSNEELMRLAIEDPVRGIIKF